MLEHQPQDQTLDGSASAKSGRRSKAMGLKGTFLLLSSSMWFFCILISLTIHSANIPGNEDKDVSWHLTFSHRALQFTERFSSFHFYFIRTQSLRPTMASLSRGRHRLPADSGGAQGASGRVEPSDSRSRATFILTWPCFWNSVSTLVCSSPIGWPLSVHAQRQGGVHEGDY